MKKISVIVPIYNVEKYLARCVRSICNQTYRNLEIILVDDGSPDNSGAMCDQFAEMDSRIRVVHKKNGGLSDARNAGIEVATGDYIAFLDSDDWVDPTWLEVLFNLCEKHDAEIAECSFRNFYPGKIHEETDCTGEVMEFTPVEAMESNLDWRFCKPVAWNKLYRADIVGDIRYPVGKIHEDEFTTHHFYLAAKKIVYIDMSLLNYERRNMGSITASFKLKNMACCEAFRERMYLVWSRPDLSSIERKMTDSYAWVCLDRLEKSKQFDLHGPEVDQTLSNLFKDYPLMKEHGLNPEYNHQIEALM